ncbi:hypothetical protein O3Q51_10810 [Cryomorphaceae bacterium 1068]|nr:hypothetical protein [Cryomorphaceae bacterium 1068]
MAEKPKEKVFCIGLNKTGTTSLEKFMEIHEFSCGDQVKGELLLSDFSAGNFQAILDFCDSADFFQDLPFSAPNCYKILLTAYPDAKYILTVRDNADVWYDSLVRFHESVFGKPLTKELLMSVKYRYVGFAWEANRALYNSPEGDPYNRDSLIETYNTHRSEVIDAFENRKNLLVLNVGEEKALSKLSVFLEIEPMIDEMPWLNKTVKA